MSDYVDIDLDDRYDFVIPELTDAQLGSDQFDKHVDVNAVKVNIFRYQSDTDVPERQKEYDRDRIRDNLKRLEY